jgi:DNA-binding GntR family transcriptional regulator
MSETEAGSRLPQAARRGLADEAADLIRQAIFDGVFAPGAPLAEVELARSLGVSRGSVREGLAQLGQEGLLVSGWHRGTRVIDITVHDVVEVYNVRSALDRLAAVSARQTAGPEAFDQLDALVESLAGAVRDGADGPALLALDLAFHDGIYAAAANARLTAAWRAVRSQMYLFQLRRVALDHQHYRERVLDEHRELAGLLRSGDLGRLAAMAEEHVHSARRSLVARLG